MKPCLFGLTGTRHPPLRSIIDFCSIVEKFFFAPIKHVLNLNIITLPKVIHLSFVTEKKEKGRLITCSNFLFIVW